MEEVDESVASKVDWRGYSDGTSFSRDILDGLGSEE